MDKKSVLISDPESRGTQIEAIGPDPIEVQTADSLEDITMKSEEAPPKNNPEEGGEISESEKPSEGSSGDKPLSVSKSLSPTEEVEQEVSKGEFIPVEALPPGADPEQPSEESHSIRPSKAKSQDKKSSKLLSQSVPAELRESQAGAQNIEEITPPSDEQRTSKLQSQNLTAEQRASQMTDEMTPPSDQSEPRSTQRGSQMIEEMTPPSDELRPSQDQRTSKLKSQATELRPSQGGLETTGTDPVNLEAQRQSQLQSRGAASGVGPLRDSKGQPLSMAQPDERTSRVGSQRTTQTLSHGQMQTDTEMKSQGTVVFDRLDIADAGVIDGEPRKTGEQSIALLSNAEQQRASSQKSKGEIIEDDITRATKLDNESAPPSPRQTTQASKVSFHPEEDGKTITICSAYGSKVNLANCSICGKKDTGCCSSDDENRESKKTCCSSSSSRQSVNECEALGKAYACKLRDLETEQKIFAEKLISDIFFEAQLNALTRDTRLNTGSSEESKENSVVVVVKKKDCLTWQKETEGEEKELNYDKENYMKQMLDRKEENCRKVRCLRCNRFKKTE